MKVTFKSITFGLIFSIGMLSCVSEAKPKNDEKDEKKVLTAESAAVEFCECSEKEDGEKQACFDVWIETYKNMKASEDEGRKMGEAMAACAPMDAIEVLMKAAE